MNEVTKDNRKQSASPRNPCRREQADRRAAREARCGCARRVRRSRTISGAMRSRASCMLRSASGTMRGSRRIPTRVRVGGRMMFKRVMGKASFAKLADRTGQIQIFLQQETLGESHTTRSRAGTSATSSAPKARCSARRRASSACAPSACVLLVKSLRPLPDKWHGLADTETRYRQRYVDLIMNDQSREVFRTRTQDHALSARLPRCARFPRSRDADDAADSGRRGARSRSSRITTRSTWTCTCASRRSCISSGWWSAASSACTRSIAISATKGCPRSTTPSSRCSSCISRTPTTAISWTGSRRRCAAWREAVRGSTKLEYQGRAVRSVAAVPARDGRAGDPCSTIRARSRLSLRDPDVSAQGVRAARHSPRQARWAGQAADRDLREDGRRHAARSDVHLRLSGRRCRRSSRAQR